MPRELRIDRHFEALCPADTDSLTLLEQAILADGCRDAIVVWANHDDIILDGHNRYRICKKHGIAFKTVALKFESRAEAIKWIGENQMGRRNLNESQRAMLAARMSQGEHGGDRKSENQDANLHLDRKTASAITNVSTRSTASAAKVIEHGSTALQKAVDSCEIPVSVAAEVAELSPAEQKKLVKAGPAAVKEAAKEHKAEKKADKPKKAKKPSGGATFDPGEWVTPVSDVKDGLGGNVPAELIDVFRAAEEFDGQRNALTQMKKWINQRRNHPAGAILDSEYQRIMADLNNLDAQLRFAQPHCCCCYCHNKPPKVEKCTACKGNGWISEEVYKQAPKGMKHGKPGTKAVSA